MKSLFFAAAAAAALVSSPAHAIKCAAPGSLNVFKAPGGYVFLVSKAYGDAAFMIPGQNFTKDPVAPPGSTQFNVDQVHYQFLSVPKSKFVGSVATSDDASVLAQHARQEQQFAVKAGSPFKVFEDLGVRKRAAEGASPAMSFKTWSLKDATKPKGPAQYMLTTVVGDEVALLSAIVPGPAQEAGAKAVFERFAASYRFIGSQKECPAMPKAPATP
jgi:hypothetical protein